MYTDFYNLNKEPFQVTPDPEFLFLSPGHREALASILYGLGQRKGFIKLVGEVGVGKTTILRWLLDRAARNSLKFVYLFHPAVSFRELMVFILRELGITHTVYTVADMIDLLNQFLIEEYRNNRLVVLVIDEAQNVPVETLEHLRMLGNLESSKDKLLQILLCGQPELDGLLQKEELRQLRQRIAVQAAIHPLSREESIEYIRHRLARACGDSAKIFSPDALMAIVRRAEGIPRMINILCDNAMIAGFGCGEKTVSRRTSREVIDSFEGRRASSFRKWISGASLFRSEGATRW